MKRNEIIMAIAMIALGLMAPWVLPSVWTTVLSIFCYYTILTIGWNIIFGYTGLFSYGHVAFPAIGGYTSALLAEHLGLSPFLGLLAGPKHHAAFPDPRLHRPRRADQRCVEPRPVVRMHQPEP